MRIDFRYHVGAVLGSLLLFLTACGSSTDGSGLRSSQESEHAALRLPTSNWQPGTSGGGEASIGGMLRAAPNGCIYLEGESGSRQFVLWPSSYSASRASTGGFEVHDDRGTVVANEGDRITASGGSQTISKDDSGCLPPGETTALRIESPVEGE